MDRKLTVKQRVRLETTGALPVEPKVIGWDEKKKGPVIKFENGTRAVIPRDGGIAVVQDR